MESLISDFEDALLSVDRIRVRDILSSYPSEKIMDSLETIVVPAMENIGKRWESGEIALSQIYMGGRISEEVISELLENSTLDKRKDDPKLAVVLFSDHHGLGKRIVHTIVKASGYEIVDYDRMDSPQEIVDAMVLDDIKILLISTLMLNSALKISEITSLIKERDLNIKVVVGGAPFRFDKNLYREVGADAMGINASDILQIIPKLKEQL
jgi:trimethylamine corrinoid protein